MARLYSSPSINPILWRKWGSYLAIVLLSAAVPLALTAFSILSFSSAFILFLSSFALSATLSFIHIFQRRQNAIFASNQRALNLHNSHEREIASVVKMLAKKAKITPPTVKVQYSKKSAPFLGAQATSWPYPNQIIFSQDLLTVYRKSLSQQVFTAKMAHEISHIQHHDAFYEEILKIFKITLLLSCLISLVIIWMNSTLIFVPILPMILVGAMTVGSEFFFCMWSRAKETLADMNAVSLTSQPQSVVNFLYDKYYQMLYFGRLAYEGKNGGEKIWRYDDKPSITLLKNKHTLYRHLPRNQIYAALKKDAKKLKRKARRDESKSSPLLWRYSILGYRKAAKVTKFASSWFSDYPRCHERAAVVLSTTPKGF